MKIVYINNDESGKIAKVESSAEDNEYPLLTITEILNKYDWCRGYNVERVFGDVKPFNLETHMLMARSHNGEFSHDDVTFYHKCTNSDYYEEFCGFEKAFYIEHESLAIYSLLAAYSHLAKAIIDEDSYYFEESFLENSPKMWGR